MTPEKFLTTYDPAVAKLAQRTREFLLTNIPAVKEELDIPAKLISFSLGPGYKGAVNVILLSKKGVKLAFFKGAELPDPENLLEGTGKVHRYVVISDEKILKSKALKKLLTAAIKACKERLAK
jgi:hypothetical protein